MADEDVLRRTGFSLVAYADHPENVPWSANEVFTLVANLDEAKAILLKHGYYLSNLKNEML